MAAPKPKEGGLLDAALNFNLNPAINAHIPASFTHAFPRPISHFLGYRSTAQSELPATLVTLHATFASFIAIILVACTIHFSPLNNIPNMPPVIPSLGAGAVLNLLLVDNPSSQPRPTIVGQFVSAFVGVTISFSPLPQWLCAPIACALAVLAMRLADAVHPPGGATAILCCTTLRGMGWVLVGIVTYQAGLMVAAACLLDNLGRQYPVYWWYSGPSKRDRERDREALEKRSQEEYRNERVCPHCGHEREP